MKKITIKIPDLLAILKKAKEVVAKHPAMRILDNILVKVKQTNAEVIVTDLLVTVIGNMEIINDADAEYSFLLPFDYIYHHLQLITTDSLTIELVVGGGKTPKTNAVLTSYADEFKLTGLEEPADFPELPQFSIENSVGIDSEFISWMGAAAHTVSNDGNLPALQKILLKIKDGVAAVVSTNSYVLLEKTFTVEQGKDVSLLVNTKVAKALKGMKETSLSWNDAHLCFVSNNMKIIGTLQSEKYPNYKSIIPKADGSNLSLATEELRNAMRMVELTGENSTVHLKKEKGHIIIEGKADGRTIKVKVPATYTGEVDKVIITPKYMLQLLGQISYVSLQMNVISDTKAIMITTESDMSYRSLITQMVN